MKFNSDVNSWIPFGGGVALVPKAGSVNNVYTINKNRVLRIVPAADMYIKFSDDINTAIASNVNILLKAGIETFVSSGQYSFMSASVATANIIELIKS